MKNPWQTISSRTVYQNDWIAVREDQVIRPDGQPGIYGVVQTKVAVATIALTSEQEVYLVGQYRYPVDEYSWEIVEGAAEKGEDSLAAAQRELKEETGLSARHWRRLGGDLHLSNCFSDEVGVCYVATDLTEGPSEPEGSEVLEVKKVPLGQAYAMVRAGQIKDIMSVAALLLLVSEQWELGK